MALHMSIGITLHAIVLGDFVDRVACAIVSNEMRSEHPGACYDGLSVAHRGTIASRSR